MIANRLIIGRLTVGIVIFPVVKIINSSVLAIAHIVNKIALPFFYVNKFPTIQPNVCKQLWGSHGHGQTQ
ncbi:hypothetical protein DBY68_015180 [Pseudocitrobacter sp. RIT415]|nr:hypothetical protein DBY68_015180 [Pseudocitrobacter sp. RIT 415]